MGIKLKPPPPGIAKRLSTIYFKFCSPQLNIYIPISGEKFFIAHDIISSETEGFLLFNCDTDEELKLIQNEFENFFKRISELLNDKT